MTSPDPPCSSQWQPLLAVGAGTCSSSRLHQQQQHSPVATNVLASKKCSTRRILPFFFLLILLLLVVCCGVLQELLEKDDTKQWNWQWPTSALFRSSSCEQAPSSSPSSSLSPGEPNFYYYNATGKITGASQETLEMAQFLADWQQTYQELRRKGDDDDHQKKKHDHYTRYHHRNDTSTGNHQPQRFQIKMFPVQEYGAVGDGQTLNTEAFRRAFQAAADYVKPNNMHRMMNAGNKTTEVIHLAVVSVEHGRYKIGGTIDLYSYTFLYVDATAVLMGSATEKDYPYPSSWESEGNPLYPNGILPILIRAKQQQHHVGILGHGVIDGGAVPGFIQSYNASIDKFVPRTFRQTQQQQSKYLSTPLCQGECRPQLVLIEQCDSIVVQDITLQNSPDWTLHVRGSSNVLLTRLHIHGDWRWPNNDGVDIDSCHNVTLTHSTIQTADDSICIKTTQGYGTCENIWIHHNVVQSRSSAFKIGSSTQENVSQVLVDHLRILAGTNRGLAVQHRDAGSISHIHIRNVVMEDTQLQPHEAWWGTGEAIYITSTPRFGQNNWPLGQVYNITLENIRAFSVAGTSFVSSRPNRYAQARNHHNSIDLDSRSQENRDISSFPSTTISNLAFLDVKLCMANSQHQGRDYHSSSPDIIYERPSKDYRPTDIEPNLQAFPEQQHIGLYLEHVLGSDDSIHNHHHHDILHHGSASAVYFHDSSIVFPPPAAGTKNNHYYHQSTTISSSKKQICLAGDSSALPGLECHQQTFCDF